MEIPTNQGFPYVYNIYKMISDHKDTEYPIYVLITNTIYKYKSNLLKITDAE